MVYRKAGHVNIKFIGAIMVIIVCGGFGFQIAAEHIREEKMLREFVRVIDFMECELQYRLTALPELCRQGAGQCKGILNQIFLHLTEELENQVSPDVSCCVQAVLAETKNIPPITAQMMKQLGLSLGRFDIDGQLRGLEALRHETERNLTLLCEGKEQRLRSYQTLGLCTGVALVILFV